MPIFNICLVINVEKIVPTVKSLNTKGKSRLYPSKVPTGKHGVKPLLKNKKAAPEGAACGKQKVWGLH